MYDNINPLYKDGIEIWWGWLLAISQVDDRYSGSTASYADGERVEDKTMMITKCINLRFKKSIRFCSIQYSSWLYSAIAIDWKKNA